MGIIKQASDDFDTMTAAFKASATPTKTQFRKYIAALADRANLMLQRIDQRDANAAQAFAATKQAQFASFVDALPEPTLDPVDPQT